MVGAPRELFDEALRVLAFVGEQRIQLQGTRLNGIVRYPELDGHHLALLVDPRGVEGGPRLAVLVGVQVAAAEFVGK